MTGKEHGIVASNTIWQSRFATGPERHHAAATIARPPRSAPAALVFPQARFLVRLIDRLKTIRRSAVTLRDALRPGVRSGASADGEGFQITLDYPVHPRSRYGYGEPAHPRLEEIIGAGKGRYASRLGAFADLRDALLGIPWSNESALEPWWHNSWYCGLDAVSLYSFLAIDQPARLIEVGSGNSTKFARRAIRDHGLPTHLTSIDPRPRAEIDELCDRVIRQPLEEVDLAVFDSLTSGDICFMDGSHRAFMNSDATVFFTEVLPRLASGVLVHVHDCFLPWDYPPQVAEWYWSEQYLLACWLLGGDALEVVMPNFYVSTEPELHHVLDPLFDHFTWSNAATNGTGFWFRIR